MQGKGNGSTDKDIATIGTIEGIQCDHVRQNQPYVGKKFFPVFCLFVKLLMF